MNYVEKSGSKKGYTFFENQEPVKRKVGLYFEEQTAAELFKRTIGPVVASTATGALIGGIAGGCVGGPPGIVSGVLIGGVSGLIIGSIVGAAINYREFNKWLKLHIEAKAFAEFEKLHFDHPTLAEFLDPYTQKIMFDPVRVPDGRIYDRSTINSMKNINGVITDPLDDSQTIDRVENAPEVLAKLKAVYCKLLVQEENEEFSLEVKNGLQALVRDLEVQVKNYINREMATLQGQYNSGQIQQRELRQKTNELFDRMDPEV